MAFHTFGPGLALDDVTGRGIPAVVARLVDAETGDPVQAYTMDDEPIETAVSTNRYGYFGYFQVPDTVRRLRLTFGGLTLEHTAWELIDEAEQAAQQARNDAELARIAAELAATLVDAPADDVIAGLIQQEGSQTQAAGDSRYLQSEATDAAIAALVAEEGSATQSAGDARWTTPENVEEKVNGLVELGPAEDLNTITTPNQYRQALNAGARDGQNYPTPYAGYLQVRAAGNTVYQVYQSFASAAGNNFFWRSAYNGVWVSWKRATSWDELRSANTNLIAGIGAAIHHDGYIDTSGSNGGYEVTALGGDALKESKRGWKNTAVGFAALRDCVDGYMNVAVGNSALERTVGGIGDGTPNGNAPGARNTALGSNAGRYNISGRGNTYIGRDAGHSALTGDGNTAVGAYAWTGVVDGEIHSSKTGNYNTALGYGAGYFNDSDKNVAIGYYALSTSIDKTSYGNVAVGPESMRNSEARENTGLGNETGKNVTTGRFQIAIGARALGSTSTAVTGNSNTAIGAASLPAVTAGAFNIGIGQEALTPIQTGSGNVALGHKAGYTMAATIEYGVSLGYEANAAHNRSVALGYQVSTTASDQVNFGAKHLEIRSAAVVPASPSGAVRLWYGTSGGKGILKALFPTGGEIIIAREA